MSKLMEGSQAVAKVVNLCEPAVVSAYPITPQTHIVEDLAKYKADGKAKYEYIRAESEFAAASVVLGASATGVRTYTATSSQGLLLMTEVLFNIAGMRLPVVLTCANRAVSAPISIWNDQQDAMTVRDSGWIMFFAEDNQEAVDLHPIAYKVSEATRLPVMVNMDGFILTHTYEPIDLPSEAQLKKFLPKYQPEKGQFLDVHDPKSLGCFATPDDYMEIRRDLFDDMKSSEKIIKQEFSNYKKIFKRGSNGLTEYYGHKKADMVFVAMGSVVGTVKEAVDELNDQGLKCGVLKLKVFRPFPVQEVVSKLSGVKKVAVLEKAVSIGAEGVLAGEVKACLNSPKQKIQSFIVGLGGRDVTRKNIKSLYKKIQQKNNKTVFSG